MWLAPRRLSDGVGWPVVGASPRQRYGAAEPRSAAAALLLPQFGWRIVHPSGPAAWVPQPLADPCHSRARRRVAAVCQSPARGRREGAAVIMSRSRPRFRSPFGVRGGGRGCSEVCGGRVPRGGLRGPAEGGRLYGGCGRPIHMPWIAEPSDVRESGAWRLPPKLLTALQTAAE